MYYLINKKVGIEISEEYINKWGTFDMETISCPVNQAEFLNTPYRMILKRVKKINIDGCMKDDFYYYSSEKFVDTKLGICVIKETNNIYIIEATQHCPEWFSLMCEIMLLQVNCTFIHAAALEKDGDAVLFPARGGVGKTATVVDMVRSRGWRLLGDDIEILDGNRHSIYSYLKRFVIYGYHKSLFPELFKTKRESPKIGNKISKMVSAAIPLVKRVLRPFPRILNFARKHNPQSMKVLPKDIFEEGQLSSKADRILKTVWLERIVGTEVRHYKCQPEEIASRAAAITLGEITYGAMNLTRPLNIMCGCGFLDYKGNYKNIYEIMLNVMAKSDTSILEIPINIPVEKVSKIVIDSIAD